MLGEFFFLCVRVLGRSFAYRCRGQARCAAHMLREVPRVVLTVTFRRSSDHFVHYAPCVATCSVLFARHRMVLYRFDIVSPRLPLPAGVVNAVLLSYGGVQCMQARFLCAYSSNLADSTLLHLSPTK